MIAKVAKRGSRSRGLIEYLFGPGRADEHTDQRIVAAWDDVWVGIVQPDEIQRALLAAEFDSSWRLLGENRRPERYVYHVPMSNHADDRELTDEEWRTAAERMVHELGLDGSDGKAPVRWFAVNHGKSSGGQDHIHLVVSLVREDGTKVWFDKPDFPIAAKTAAALTREFGLPVRTREMGAGERPLSRPEVTKQRATNSESPRERLRRAVRAAATAARTESEWVTEMRRMGVQLRPRWAPGGRTEVQGYSAALPTTPGPDGQRPALTWFGGGRLGRDLTLPALRAGWTADPMAVDTWRALDPKRPPTPRRQLDPAVLDRAANEVQQALDRLRSVPLDDQREWAAVAREVAGALAALAERTTGREHADLARAALQLGRTAQLSDRPPHVGRPGDGRRLADVARAVLMVSLIERGGPVAFVALVYQLITLVDAIRRAHAAAGRTAQASTAARSVAYARRAATTVAPAGPGATQTQTDGGPARHPLIPPARRDPRNGERER